MKEIVIDNIKYKRFEDYKYFVSKCGKVYSEHYNKIMKPTLDLCGYHTLLLTIKTNKRKLFQVGRLLLFVYSKDKYFKGAQCNHIDGNKLNNNISNLEWVTPSQNVKHSHAIGLRPMSRKILNDMWNNNIKISDKDMEAIKKDKRASRTIAKDYNISYASVNRIRNDKQRRR